MNDAATFAVHTDPVWRERSNFIINAKLEDDDVRDYEQLFVAQRADETFEICCIPFFVYGIALGDVVSVKPADSLRYVVDAVVSASGRYVFRVWFGDSFHPRDEIETALHDLEALTEWSSPNLLAVDAKDAAAAKLIANFLADRERAGVLLYETGRGAQSS